MFEDVITALAEKEKLEEKRLKERNAEVLGQIFDSMTSVTYKTSWAVAYELLLEEPLYKEDDELQGMKKES